MSTGRSCLRRRKASFSREGEKERLGGGASASSLGNGDRQSYQSLSGEGGPPGAYSG